MALDQQRNWTVSMAENLEQVKRKGRREGAIAKSTVEGLKNMTLKKSVEKEEKAAVWNTEPVYLPDEIIIHILEFVAASPYGREREVQGTLASCCLLSRQWHAAAIPPLYRRPYLYGKNFDLFVRVICPSINLQIRESPLAQFVRTLNMANLVHQGSKSVTARLLGRTKNNLEEFVAPQASFATNCFPALGKCHHLRQLDLSLVSESPPLPELFKRVCLLDNLKVFRLPRSAGFGVNYQSDSFNWPPNLQDLSLSGGIDAHFLHGVVSFPQSLRHLTIEHCPLARRGAIKTLIRNAVRPLANLDSLTIRYMPRLSSHALDSLLFLLPQLKKLSVSVDYITPAIFDEERAILLEVQDATDLELEASLHDGGAPSFSLRNNQLHSLDLTSSGNPGVEDKVSPMDLLIAVDEGCLPALRKVRVARQLHWHSNAMAEDLEALADVLREASQRDWERGEGEFANRGYGRGEREKEEEKKIWDQVAGVWLFDG